MTHIMTQFQNLGARGAQKWPFSKTIFLATDHLLPARAGANNLVVGEMIMATHPPCLHLVMNKSVSSQDEFVNQTYAL